MSDAFWVDFWKELVARIGSGKTADEILAACQATAAHSLGKLERQQKKALGHDVPDLDATSEEEKEENDDDGDDEEGKHDGEEKSSDETPTGDKAKRTLY